MNSITIPIEPGSATDEQIKKICKDFYCDAVKKHSCYWEIHTSNPSNFFWLGINLNQKISEVQQQKKTA